MDSEYKSTITEEEGREQLNAYSSDAEKIVGDKDKMDEFLEKLAKKLSAVPGIGDKIADIPILVTMVKAYVNKEYTTIPVASIVSIVAGLLYFISPIDLIPDFIPVAGYLDDAVVIGIVVKMIHSDVENFKEWQKENGKR